MLNKTIKKTYTSLIILALLVVVFSASVAAVAVGYVSRDTGLQPGMVVALSDEEIDGKPAVQRASRDRSDKIIGVSLEIEESAVTIVSSGKSVYVESEGDVIAYVTDMDGKIKQGDHLKLSPINGVLTKQTSSDGKDIGVALEDMPMDRSESYGLKVPEGEKNVKVARMKINFSTGGLAGGAGDEASSLENIANNVVGRQVNGVRVAGAMFIFIVVLIAEAALLYGTISSSIVSIGRNPLASKKIKKEILKISLISGAILLFGIVSIYLILWH